MIAYMGTEADTEYMGIFGFSWQEKVGDLMRTQLVGTAAFKKMSSFWSPGGINTNIVNSLYNNYAALMAKGYSPVYFTTLPDSKGKGGSFDAKTISLAQLLINNTGQDSQIVTSFLRALFVLARDGKIPYAKWDPAGVAKNTALRKTFSTEQGFLDKIAGFGNTSKLLLLVVGLGTGAYLLSQINQFKGSSA